VKKAPPKLKERTHPDAAAELRAAAKWYSSRKVDLGSDLVRLARITRKEIALTPNRWAVFLDWTGTPVVRSRHLPKFPYRIIYYSDEKYLSIIAYAHESREPGFWQSRVNYWDSPAEE